MVPLLHMNKPARRGLWGLKCGLAAILTTLAVTIELTAVPLEASGALDGMLEWMQALLLSCGGLPVVTVPKSSSATSVLYLVLFAAVLVWYGSLWAKKRKFLPSAALVGLLFSLFVVVGQCYERYDSWAPLLDNPYQRTLALIKLAGYWVFFHSGVSTIFHWLDKPRPPLAQPPALDRKQQAKVYGACILLVLLCWLPYLLICYPGSMATDGLRQLEQTFGTSPHTNHHPWFSTLLMTWIVERGGSLERGVFLYVVFQSLVCAAAFGAMCGQIWVQSRSRLWTGLTLAFFALVPTWGAYAQMFIKDTLFYGTFAAFFLCVVLFVQRKGRCGWPVWAGMFFFGFVTSMLRNNGLYTVVPTVLLLTLAVRAKAPGKADRQRTWLCRAAAAGMAVVIFGSCGFWNKTLLPKWGVAPGSVREMLSLPFQQTARYARDYGEELTQEDIAVLDRVLDYEVIAARYDPRVSDPVKNTYRGEDDDLKDYFKVWLKCGLRHPDAYMEATLNSMFGYFLPGYRYGNAGGNYFYMRESEQGINMPFAHPDQVRGLDYYTRLWCVTPGLMLLNVPGTFSWLLILCTAALLRKRKWTDLLVTLPVWLSLGICCISPVNGLVRYMLPIMAVTPLMLFYVRGVLREPERKDVSNG